jgi:hypothetical protein
MSDMDLVGRVSESTGLSEAEATRVIADVVDYYAESAADFVRRRHARLRALGLKNDEIFATIRAELSHRVVAPPDLSERQLRRLVYG